jgi:drug/metabolite transporter (DMT)-like permease
MLGTLLALSCSGLWGVSDFLGGSLGRRVSLLQILVASQLAGLVAGVAIALVLGGAPSLGPWVLVPVGAGVSSIFGLGALYRGLAIGAMGVVAPIAALGALIPIGVGLASGDRPSTAQVAGMAVVLLGVSVTTRELRSEQTPAGARTRQAVLLAVVAAVGLGLAQLALAEGARTDPYWTIGFMRIAALLTIVAYAATLGPGVPRPREYRGQPTLPLFVIGLADVSAMTSYALATKHGELSVVTALSSLYPVVTVLLATVLLRERLNRPQVVGASVTLVGAALLSAGV